MILIYGIAFQFTLNLSMGFLHCLILDVKSTFYKVHLPNKHLIMKNKYTAFKLDSRTVALGTIRIKVTWSHNRGASYDSWNLDKGVESLFDSAFYWVGGFRFRCRRWWCTDVCLKRRIFCKTIREEAKEEIPSLWRLILGNNNGLLGV